MSSFRFCWWLSAFIALTILRAAAGRPEITQHPSEHNAYPNEAFSMSCAASGSEFRMWIVESGQDRREIKTSNSDYGVTRTTSSSTLTIKAFKRELAGEYRCLFTTENIGSILTKPAAVKHFAQVTVEKQPQNFQSYILHASNGAVYRDVFAFQCSFHTEPFAITPVITWEQCNPDNTFSPVVEATQTVPAPGLTATNIVTPTHIFFQTNATGYLQIHDTNNSAHQGTRYRCKASSSIALDTQAPVYSGCAQIIYQANTVPVPEDLPVFATVPHNRVYFDRGHQPVMACSVQRRTNLLPPKLVHSEEVLALPFISFLPSTTHISTSHLTLLGQLNLQFNGNAAVDMDIFEQTFTCQAHLNGESILHNTTFYRDRPLLPTSDSSFTNHTFREGDRGTLNFMFKQTPSFQQVRVFNNGQRTALSYSPGPSNDRLIFTIAQVGAHHEGVTQLEVENRANIVTQYHYVHVLLMARSITPNRSVKGRVTQTLKIKSKAKVNLVDTFVNFTWKIGDQEYTRRVPAMDGMATDEFVIKDLNMAEYHGKSLGCYPSNSVGGYNFTRFDISVERFPAPNITKFAFQPDSKDTVDIEWLPVDVTGYPGASVEEYVIELARDKDGSDIEARFNSTGDNVSYVIPLKECSKDYWVRIKAMNGDQDVSEFSDWTAITATGCPLVAVPAPQPLQEWAIFLIVFFLLLLCCLCLFLYCCIVLLLTRDKEGEYNAEKREKQYQSYRAAYTVRQEHECATLAKLSYVSTEQWTQMDTV